ncbi:hypothetical protein CL619_04150 [archaeon]|nr:hypothetical protein [archaeon]|tara:strand:- start:701 stop:1498 length:798 start_codon:yes stop_codon:yes gene_type:complete
MATKQSFRAEAKLVPLSYLYLGKYVVGNETSASYLKLENKEELIRINCVAAVVRREDLGSITVFTIDDGSDNISVRIFDKRKHIDSINVGQVILVVGRIREYNTERYIAAEIIHSVESRWLKYRSLLLHSKMQKMKNEKIVDEFKKEETKEEIESVVIQETPLNTMTYSSTVDTALSNNDSTFVGSVTLEKKEKVVETSPVFEVANTENPYLELMSLISKLDSGKGVALEVIINESNYSNTEELLQKMMETGDIFQNMPGKVKVL